MLRLIVVVALIFILMQTSFYKEEIVPRYKKFEAEIVRLLDTKAKEIRSDGQTQAPVTPPSTAPVSFQEASEAFQEPVDTYGSRLGTGKKKVSSDEE